MSGEERVIVIAANMRDGRMWAETVNIRPLCIITPLSLSAARGFTADRIEVTAQAATHPRLDAMRAEAAPALASSGGGA